MKAYYISKVVVKAWKYNVKVKPFFHEFSSSRKAKKFESSNSKLPKVLKHKVNVCFYCVLDS